MRGTEWTVSASEAGGRLDKFLASRSRLGSRGRAAAALERRKVFLNDGEVTVADASRRLVAGDAVRVWMDRPGSAKPVLRAGRFGDLDIVFEDEVLLVVNKPAGVLAVPLPDEPDSVLDRLEQHFRSHRAVRPYVVHRIDRDTSGLVVFAKTAAAQQLLKDQFRRRQPERTYWAVVYGHPRPDEGTWRDRLMWDERLLIQKATHPKDPKGREAVCHYRVLEKFADVCLLEVRLHTGRQNQIRIQAAVRGHTLVGEKRYVSGPEERRTIPFERQALHAYRLEFRHPIGGTELQFEAPPPRDFKELLRRLRRGPHSD